MHPLVETALAEIAGDPPCVDAALLEMLAEHAEELRDGDGPEGLAKGQGVDVEFDRGFPDGHDGIALYDDKLLIVRPSKDRATQWLRILHELGHWMLMDAGWSHSHGDVWLLALALGAPKSLVRRERPGSALALAACSGLPAWAASVRFRVLAA
ncbi:MAG: hypothetical protein ACEQSX_10745 [Baekduiaceae bacterium]